MKIIIHIMQEIQKNNNSFNNIVVDFIRIEPIELKRPTADEFIQNFIMFSKKVKKNISVREAEIYNHLKPVIRINMEYLYNSDKIINKQYDINLKDFLLADEEKIKHTAIKLFEKIAEDWLSIFNKNSKEKNSFAEH